MTELIIAGCPRSGTTALRNLLNTQHNTYLCNELSYYSSDSQEHFMSRLNSEWWNTFCVNCKKDNINPEAFRSYITEDKLKSVDFLHSQGYEIVGDKYPLYVAQKHHKKLLEAANRGVKIILCVRDCRGFVSSSIRHYISSAHGKQSTWAYCTIHDACKYWTRFNRGLIQLTNKLPPESYMIVKYEEAVNNKEKLLRRLHKLTNNKWYGNINDTKDYHPVHVDSWKTEHPKIDYHLSEDALRLMELYGYDHD